MSEGQRWAVWSIEAHRARFPNTAYSEPQSGPVWDWYRQARIELAKVGQGDGELQAGYLEYLAAEDEFLRKRGHPWALWAKQWASYVTAATSEKTKPRDGRAIGRSEERAGECAVCGARGKVHSFWEFDLCPRHFALADEGDNHSEAKASAWVFEQRRLGTTTNSTSPSGEEAAS